MKTRQKTISAFLIISFLLVPFFSGCNDKSTEPSLADSYMPLKEGNKWFYSSFTHLTVPDITRISDVWEVVGTRIHRGMEFYIIKRTFVQENNNFSDSVYYANSGDNLYQLFVPKGGAEYVSMPAMFNIRDNGTFNYKSESLEYTVTNLGKDGDKIKFMYDSPNAVDEEHTVVYQAGKGIYETYSAAWGIGRRLVKAELK